jgi:hypothetical protein
MVSPRQQEAPARMPRIPMGGSTRPRRVMMADRGVPPQNFRASDYRTV